MDPHYIPTIQTEPAPRESRLLHIVLIVASVMLLALAAIVVYKRMNPPLTPEASLQLLEQTSQPVTATPQERKIELNELQQQSRPVSTTPDNRLRALQQLQ